MLINSTAWSANITRFELEDLSFVSKLRFLVNGGQGLFCTLWVRNDVYVSSADSAFWSIVSASNGGTRIKTLERGVIWTTGTSTAEKFVFLKDGNMVLLDSEAEVLWQTDTSTLMLLDSIFYADRAVLTDDGQLWLTDNATLTKRRAFNLANSSATGNALKKAYAYHLACDSSKYDFVDKRYGFYASWVDYLHCADNEFVFNATTPCLLYTFCAAVQQFEIVLLEPSGSQSNCRVYDANWHAIANNYVMFELSVSRTPLSAQPKLYALLTADAAPHSHIAFGAEFASNASARTLLVTVSPSEHTISLRSELAQETFHVSRDFFNGSKSEWIWLDWSWDFDYLRIGNSRFIESPLFHVKFSTLFGSELRLQRNAMLFSALNFAWDTAEDECYGLVVVQIPPLDVAVAQGCFENFTKTTIFENTSLPTPAPTRAELSTTHDGDNDDAAHDDDADMSTVSVVLIALGCLVLCAAVVVASIVYMRRRWAHSTDLVAHEIDIGVATAALIGSDGNETASAVSYVRMEDTFDDAEEGVAGADPDDANL